MSRLPLAKLRSRLALDYRAMHSLRGATLGRIEAFVSPLDLERRREATDAEGLDGLATVYRVEFRFRMLLTPDRELQQARAIFETSPHGYPFVAPRVAFASDAIPFSPHIQRGSGMVCLGEAWTRARGNWLLPHLVIHVMKLANFDEPCTRDGFDRNAVNYARYTLEGRPLNPDLDYPVVDERITHSGSVPAADPPAPVFRRSSGFAPRSVAAAPVEQVVFAPRPRLL